MLSAADVSQASDGSGTILARLFRELHGLPGKPQTPVQNPATAMVTVLSVLAAMDSLMTETVKLSLSFL